MKRKGGTFVLIGILVLIGLVGVQYARQTTPNAGRESTPTAQRQASPRANPARPSGAQPQAKTGEEEVELPLWQAVRDLLDEADEATAEDLGEDLDELRQMLDDVAEPWRTAKAQMRQGIREANRKFETVQD